MKQNEQTTATLLFLDRQNQDLVLCSAIFNPQCPHIFRPEIPSINRSKFTALLTCVLLPKASYVEKLKLHKSVRLCPSLSLACPMLRFGTRQILCPQKSSLCQGHRVFRLVPCNYPAKFRSTLMSKEAQFHQASQKNKDWDARLCWNKAKWSSGVRGHLSSSGNFNQRETVPDVSCDFSCS